MSSLDNSAAKQLRSDGTAAFCLRWSGVEPSHSSRGLMELALAPSDMRSWKWQIWEMF